MTAAQNFIQSQLLFSNGRDGKMLSRDEINQLDWSMFDGLDIKVKNSKRDDAVDNILLQIAKLQQQ